MMMIYHPHPHHARFLLQPSREYIYILHSTASTLNKQQQKPAAFARRTLQAWGDVQHCYIQIDKHSYMIDGQELICVSIESARWASGGWSRVVLFSHLSFTSARLLSRALLCVVDFSSLLTHSFIHQSLPRGHLDE